MKKIIKYNIHLALLPCNLERFILLREEKKNVQLIMKMAPQSQ